MAGNAGSGAGLLAWAVTAMGLLLLSGCQDDLPNTDHLKAPLVETVSGPFARNTNALIPVGAGAPWRPTAFLTPSPVNVTVASGPQQPVATATVAGFELLQAPSQPHRALLGQIDLEAASALSSGGRWSPRGETGRFVFWEPRSEAPAGRFVVADRNASGTRPDEVASLSLVASPPITSASPAPEQGGPAVGLRIALTRVDTGQRLPLGTTARRQPVYEVYTNGVGEFQAFPLEPATGLWELTAQARASDGMRPVMRAWLTPPASGSIRLDANDSWLTQVLEQSGERLIAKWLRGSSEAGGLEDDPAFVQAPERLRQPVLAIARQWQATRANPLGPKAEIPAAHRRQAARVVLARLVPEQLTISEEAIPATLEGRRNGGGLVGLPVARTLREYLEAIATAARTKINLRSDYPRGQDWARDTQLEKAGRLPIPFGPLHLARFVVGEVALGEAPADAQLANVLTDLGAETDPVRGISRALVLQAIRHELLLAQLRAVLATPFDALTLQRALGEGLREGKP
ncbi:MAG: hypothetical protein VKP62_06175 [Candidatus Sericytochromatia bacterium]|nr:hypothetical protein [Candidatus Sericytochromatia bacterium]